SPDGRELAFVSNVHDHVDLGVLDVKTKKVRFLVQSRWDKAMPLWAPDGWRIAFLENRDGNVQLKTVSRDGKGARAVSPAKGSAGREKIASGTPRWWIRTAVRSRRRSTIGTRGSNSWRRRASRSSRRTTAAARAMDAPGAV